MLCGSLTSSFASANRDLKCAWRQISRCAKSQTAGEAYLKLASELVNSAPILIVVTRIAPNEADLLLEGIPCLKIGDASWRVSAMLSTYPLLHALQRYWMPDEPVVIFQLPTGQVDEWGENLESSAQVLVKSTENLRLRDCDKRTRHQCNESSQPQSYPALPGKISQ